MEPVFKEVPLSVEYLVYLVCTCVLLLAIAILESKTTVPFLAFFAGLIAIFMSFLACWDLIAVGVRKHTIFGVIFGIITLFLFLGLIFDFIQAIA
jgi:hypothetical protein